MSPRTYLKSPQVRKSVSNFSGFKKSILFFKSEKSGLWTFVTFVKIKFKKTHRVLGCNYILLLILGIKYIEQCLNVVVSGRIFTCNFLCNYVIGAESFLGAKSTSSWQHVVSVYISLFSSLLFSLLLWYSLLLLLLLEL